MEPQRLLIADPTVICFRVIRTLCPPSSTFGNDVSLVSSTQQQALRSPINEPRGFFFFLSYFRSVS